MLVEKPDLEVKVDGKVLTEKERIDIMSEPVPASETNKIIVKDEKPKKEVTDEKKSSSVKPEAKAETNESIVQGKTPEEKEDFFDRLERELAKPHSQADLSGFTKRERAYFHQMQRDRDALRKAEEDRDAAVFREIQLKNKKDEPKQEVVEDDPFKDRDETDFLTVADIKKFNEKLAKKSEVKKDEPKVENIKPVIDVENPVIKNYLNLCDIEAKSKHADYEEVIELSKEIIGNNQNYAQQLAECFQKGTNPALKMYELIKNDPAYAELAPIGQTRVRARKAPQAVQSVPVTPPVDPEKQKKAQETEEALERNKERVRTSAHTGGSGETGSITVDEIANMSDREFAKLPKATREKYLRLYG